MPEKPMVDVTIEEHRKNTAGGNDPAQTERFRDFGFGMFIHFSLDSLLCSVISHWMISADPKLCDRFIDEYPSRFRIDDFDPGKWAFLAQQAGARYAVLTAKHHNGFCLWDTATTDFNVTRTPFGRDLLREYFAAFREYGIEPGLYFSPIDFYYNHRIAGKVLQFTTPDMLQENDPAFLAYNTRQVEELTRNYGPVYCMFFDAPPDSLKQLVWNNQPRCLVTRGEMETPEQVLPDVPPQGAWEGCYTIGDGWSYKPGDNADKTAGDLIRLLIKIRARGGNMLLNVTPDAHGTIPEQQVAVMQEIGLFNFFCGEAIYGVRPFRVLCEDDESVCYSQSKDGKTVYAYVMDGWPFGYRGRHRVTLKKLRAAPDTTVRMLGQNGLVLEHRPGIDCDTRFSQDENGLTIDARMCYRPFDNRKWNHPVVFALTNVEPVV